MQVVYDGSIDLAPARVRIHVISGPRVETTYDSLEAKLEWWVALAPRGTIAHGLHSGRHEFAWAMGRTN